MVNFLTHLVLLAHQVNQQLKKDCDFITSKSEKRKEFIINLAFYAVIAFIVYIVFKYAISYILPFLLAFGLVTLVNPIIRKIQSYFPQKSSTIPVILMVLFYALLGLLIFLIIFNVLIQFWNLAVNIADTYYPEVIKPALTEAWSAILTYIDELPPDWQQIAHNVQSNIMTQLQNFVLRLAPNLMSFVSKFTGGIPGFLIAFVFTIMLSFFISMQYDDVIKFFRAQLSEKSFDILKDLKAILNVALFKYLRAVLTLMIMTSIELMIGFSILRIEYGIIIAIGVAILDALPVFGTGAVLVPWVIIKLLQGDFRMAAGIAIIYGVVTAVRNIMEPKVVGDKLGINPIVSMVAIYIGFKLFGVFGMILMPITLQIIMELNRRGTISLYKSIPKTDKDLKQEKVQINK